ncbi:hypothetical protein PHYPSEUDO_003567 [Phytophthora pseudosyringae]|uniref:Uncharacterized protein n=1 Tax=Phytophthora pseudosyringae TaxID=221518 RepID=A0A8T1VUA3_9STRA|nr:hypothetical protein PHYPSEUDO_003567 [Phytophthora pseudosyringae]
MENTRRAIRRGRALTEEGLDEHAMTTWKAALSGAYASHDYGGMFVLSSNIGEACVRIATRSKVSIAKALKLLREAKENLDYALQIVEQCNLRDILGGYKSLYQGVRWAETLRKEAERLMDKLQRGQEEEVSCATCGGIGDKVVLDENDGCYYCRACYDEYYAAVPVDGGGEEVAVATEDLARVDGKMAAADGLEADERVVEVSPDIEQDDGGAEVIAPESDPTSKLAEPAEVASVDELIEEVARETTEDDNQMETQEKTGQVTQGRTRHERVELGSLADFLAGKLHLENEAEIQWDNGSSDAPISAAALPVDVNEEANYVEKLAGDAVDHHEERNDAGLAASDGSAPTVLDEKPPVLSEAADIADTTPHKREYSIAQLLDLRKSSSSDCPEPLLASPVCDDGTVPTPAHNSKVTNSRKKSNARKTSRSAAASHWQNKADAAGPNQVATSSISPLPTLELCAAMREALQERQTESGASSVAAGATTEAAELLGSAVRGLYSGMSAIP